MVAPGSVAGQVSSFVVCRTSLRSLGNVSTRVRSLAIILEKMERGLRRMTRSWVLLVASEQARSESIHHDICESVAWYVKAADRWSFRL